MTSMRAFFALATILSLLAPPLSWGAAVDASSPAGISMSMASQAALGSQLVRAIAKSDKTFGFGCALAAQSASLLLPAIAIGYVATLAPEPPNLNLQGSPLAPRPPPLG
jgi:hypothetical protein